MPNPDSRMLGTGLARAAADIGKLRQQYNREATESDGDIDSFEEWLKKKGVKNALMPKANTVLSPGDS